jgi:hypothetical protein
MGVASNRAGCHRQQLICAAVALDGEPHKRGQALG